MADKPIDDVLEILAQMPKLHRGLQKNVFKKVIGALDEGVTRHHIEILKLLSEEGTLHVAEIAELLLISKSQMTRLIDELFNLELIERRPDVLDRRKSNIMLTTKGEAFIADVHKNFELCIKGWLSSLSDEELRELSSSMRRIQKISFKLG